MPSPDFLRRWSEGAASDAHDHLGAHPDGQGVRFSVWAPHADAVSVIGDFNGWHGDAHPLERGDQGIWTGLAEGAEHGQRYKYRISRGGSSWDKSDPFAFHMEPPASGGSAASGLASVVTDLAYDWSDAEWMGRRKGPGSLTEPLAVYEAHLGSWRHKKHGESLSYREIAEPLADHVERLGFTHVELLPVMEHPYYGSWGYQVVGFFAPTYRYGSPQDLMHLVDTLHQRGIGVLLDWVPAHFGPDPQGLASFDGTPLYEYADANMRTHPDWGTYVFDYGKPGVVSFLLSSARYWLDRYHIDGLRVDAVASMLYRDYSRQHWTPNVYGGRENLEAIRLIQRTNEEVYRHHPEVLMIAEESTAWPGVSRPTYAGGLGFLYKWNMGWMHDTLTYISKDPAYRKHHHHELTFPLHYAFNEHFMLPISHDEVVHGKGSLWGKVPGDPWQKAATLRLLYGHMVGHPGKKLLFMGQEFGQVAEWNHDRELDWAQAEQPLHAGLLRWTEDVFRFYREQPSLHDDGAASFEWVDYSDQDQSVVSYLRHGGGKTLLFVLNATPMPRHNYRVGVPAEGVWREVLNSDAGEYGGGGIGNFGAVETAPAPHHGRPFSVVLTLPPLAVLVLEQEAGSEEKTGGAEEPKQEESPRAAAPPTAAGVGAGPRARPEDTPPAEEAPPAETASGPRPTAARTPAANPTTAEWPNPEADAETTRKAAEQRPERVTGVPPGPPPPADLPPGTE